MKDDKTMFSHDAQEVIHDVEEQINASLEQQYLLQQDQEIIFTTLKDRLSSIYHGFGEYLKRFVYQNGQFDKPFDEVSDDEYASVIAACFKQNGVPNDFKSNTTKIGQRIKNWLKQDSLEDRKTVFLLGFALKMQVDEVNEFLEKVLRQQGINPKSPFEVLCWYCYKNGYSYHKFLSLSEALKSMPAEQINKKEYSEDSHCRSSEIADLSHSDRDILSYVAELKSAGHSFSVSAKKEYEKVFGEARKLMAELKNKTAISRDGLLYGDVRTARRINPEDIGPEDIQKELSSAIPTDASGNLKSFALSSWTKEIARRRFDRKHVHNILKKDKEGNDAQSEAVTRYDLITMNFLVFSLRASIEFEENENIIGQQENGRLNGQPPKVVYEKYIESTNSILEKCMMWPVNPNDPYECFVLMCLLTYEPLSTYADVWELSYE